MRIPWPPDFPSVLTHTDYNRLKSNPLYERAKRYADADAAVDLCYEVAIEELIYGLYGRYSVMQPVPLVLAPSVAPGETNNALARGYASWLAEEIGCELETEIIQWNAAVKRDLIPGGYQRLVLEPLYEGPVRDGREYILADDMCSSGGTFASLRGFVESNGGRVILMTSLATPDGWPRQISLDPATRDEVYTAHGGQLAELIEEELGYEAACLTEAEARYLLNRASVDAIRKGLAEARGQ